MFNLSSEECPECESWDVRCSVGLTHEVEDPITGRVEKRTELSYDCRDCSFSWKDYEVVA